jgi:ribosomal subunit interface protein
MKFEVTWRNMEQDEALAARVAQKFEKVARHLRGPVEGHVIFRAEGRLVHAELLVSGAGERLVGNAEADRAGEAADAVFAKISRAARRHRERTIDRWHQGLDKAQREAV